MKSSLPALGATLALALCLGAAPVASRELRDDTGRSVEVPDAPRRIVSLHDWVLTVMATELQVPLVGTSARLTGEGRFYIRSAEELFGLTTDQVPLASLHGQTDPERIAALKPDLILANVGDNLPLLTQLSAVAPVLMLDPEAGLPPRQMYRRVADWLDRLPRFEQLAADFDAAAAAVPGDWSGCSYLPLLVNDADGTLTLARDYGGVTLAMDALGVHPAPAADLVPGGQSRARLSAEVAGSLATDILVLSYLESRGETASTPLDALDHVAPGFADYLRQSGTAILVVPREQAYPVSFRSGEVVLRAVAEQRIACVTGR